MKTDKVQKAIKSIPEVYPYLSREARKLAAKQFQNYRQLRSDYWSRIYDTIYAYLDGSKPITQYRNSMQTLVSDYYHEAADMGYEMSGGTLPINDATQRRLDDRITKELEFVAALFLLLRKKEDISDFDVEAYDRATGYTNSIDSIYLLGKLGGLKDEPLIWHLGNTTEHCKTCFSLDGTTHLASWYLENGYIPREPNSPTLDCKGFFCDCYWTDMRGKEITV
jgi:hypothetical protein